MLIIIDDVVVVMSQDSSVGIAMGYGLDCWSLIPIRGKRFFSGPQHPDLLRFRPSSYSVDSRFSFPAGKAALA
jgi:hypothetical protein